MKRIELLIYRLNRYRQLRRWLAEQRQERYDVPELGQWAQRDLNLTAPVERPEQARATVAKRPSSIRSAGVQRGLTNLHILQLNH